MSSTAQVSENSRTAFWQRHANRYDRAVFRLNGGFSKVIDSVRAHIQTTDSVLEIACGTGLLTQGITHARRALATDLSEEMLAIARARLPGSSIEFKKMDARTLESLDERFDKVLCGNLLHLLEQPTETLRAIRKALKPGGLLLAPTFCHGAGLRARLVSYTLAFVGFPVKTRFDEKSLKDLILSAGFTLDSSAHFAGVLPISFPVARTGDRQV